jgi:hypothetical protein
MIAMLLLLSGGYGKPTIIQRFPGDFKIWNQKSHIKMAYFPETQVNVYQ